jgi:hypothetical protein
MNDAPIPMILHCPDCGMQHIDKPDEASGWTNPPHRSHKCNNPDCGCIWRPADVFTTGVARIETKGTADTWDPNRNVVDLDLSLWKWLKDAVVKSPWIPQDGNYYLNDVVADLRAFLLGGPPGTPIPIEKAPVDGTEVILMVWRDDKLAMIDVGCWEEVEKRSWEEGGGSVYGWCSNEGHIEEPTHYLPMFPIPQASASDSTEEPHEDTF